VPGLPVGQMQIGKGQNYWRRGKENNVTGHILREQDFFCPMQILPTNQMDGESGVFRGLEDETRDRR
jgi:hypothetical protein